MTSYDLYDLYDLSFVICHLRKVMTYDFVIWF